MNKKFLNAILFGALAFTTVTFTSCKDYDDDIDSLSGRVDAVEKSLSDLKADFGNIAYVKSVTYSNGVLTVTPSVGTPQTYNIPADTNTTYTLSVNTTGNKATITLTPSTGSAQTATVEFTDTKLDPSLFRTVEQADGSFIVVYGKEDDAPKTGIVIPAPASASGKASVSVQVKDEETDAILGWMIDGTKLNITDVLPITSFEYIPEAILADWGERVIVFHKDNYQPVEIKNGVVTPMKTTTGAAVINYLPNQANPQYQVNPSSATLAQLENEGSAVIKGTIVEKVTKAASPVTWSKTAIEKGVMTVTLEADPTAFVEDKNKLDEIALQFTTTAGNSITTEYVGVINQSEKLALVLADKDVTAKDAKDENCHFATTLQAAIEGQVALVGADNKADEGNSHLVQEVLYSDAVAGIDLKTLVTTCNTANDKHVFFDYATKSDFELSFEPIAYNVGETPQEKYMELSGDDKSTFKAINYSLTESQSCIGKAPIVLAKLTDPNNGNAIVAAAYIKLLIVGDEAAPAGNDIIITKEEIVGLGCNTPNLTWSTNDEFMSTEVYTFKHQAEGSTLAQLSKEQFHLIYQLPEDASKDGLTITDGTVAYGTTKVSGNWTIKEEINTGDGKMNHKVTFTLTTAPLVKDKTYTVYAIYTKTDDKDKLSNVANNNMYPEKVMIAYSVKVDDINFKASIKDGNKIANYWNNNAIEIYCKTPGNTDATIGQDMLSNFEGHKVEFTYSSEFNATKYPSFAVANMDYKFYFSEDNVQKVRGYVKDAYNNEYQLFLSEDKTELHAVAKGAIETATDANLVASLSGDKNEKITYADTEVAKALLNVAPRGASNAFFAWLEVSYFNGCDLVVPVEEGTFKANFIRPVNAVANDAEKFTDGNNEGQCVIDLNKLISFTDWRNESPLNSFAEHFDYYKYYNVTKIALDANEVVKTNLNRDENTFVDIKTIFGEEGAKTLLTFDSKDNVAPDGKTLPDYGTVTYKNKDVQVQKEFKLQIPLVITYKWGTIKQTITVDVTKTL